ncbi:hypothetical protein CROQUDRAFT_100517 [Cronartium quercuum f. sp. fusiforme G11]|uniref:Uncharacterized protein n=1 Tax=Cronartium quercuum f. sp. fusiforme G11 TaxID=708437 RepID=A0A9P6N737_9BASI|nr:hypothetical protein CROQUDRAFT_100517 [Cronartium quercuum f. sp. fusiforme G11]
MSTCHAEFMAIGAACRDMKVKLEWIPGQQQLADILMKALGPKKFVEGQRGLGILSN